MKKLYFFNAGLISIPEAFIRRRVWGLREPGSGGREFRYSYLLIYSNKLAYLEIIPVFVDGSKKATIRCVLSKKVY